MNVALRRRDHPPCTSTRLSGATNTLVACETQLGFPGDGPVLNAVRAFLAT